TNTPASLKTSPAYARCPRFGETPSTRCAEACGFTAIEPEKKYELTRAASRPTPGTTGGNMPFNDRETATILAALRYWQARTLPANPERAEAIEEIATDGRPLDPLDEEEIDTLCEAINASPIEPGAVDDAPPSPGNHACADQGLQVSAEILST